MANDDDNDAERGRGRLDPREKSTVTVTTNSTEASSTRNASGLFLSQTDDAEHPSTSHPIRDNGDHFPSHHPRQSHDNNNNNNNNNSNRSHGHDDAAHSPRKWPSWIPFPIERTCTAVVRWTAGPANPQPHRIKPLFPAVQQLPLRFVSKLFPNRRRRACLLFSYLAVWLLAFVLVKRREFVVGNVAGWGAPQALTCDANFFARGNLCGLDGSACHPFNRSALPFRCPANCARHSVLNPRAVGDQEVLYRPLVVGGPPPSQQATSVAADDDDDYALESAVYRGDSYICAAAVHAAVVSNLNGGCGVVELVGRHQDFPSSSRNGITSLAFNSYFPQSFRFVPTDCRSVDAIWSFLALSVVFTAVLGLCTASPAGFYFPVFIGAFFTVGIVTDPPLPARPVAALISIVLGRFLPAAFVGWVVYDRMGVRRALAGLEAPADKIVLWLGACWVGALSNYTLGFIPIQRLDVHDLAQQPGARAALAVILIVLVCAVGFQAWCFRQEGRLRPRLRLYALVLVAILVVIFLPGLRLRIHHYVFSLVLLPGTAMQTRPSLLYQGLLIGLFVNGVARWGFAPVLETTAALQGDAQLGTPLPGISEPVIHWSNSSTASSAVADVDAVMSNITFAWSLPPLDVTWSLPSIDIDYKISGISILVNDVERYRSFFDDTSTPATEFTWSRNASLGLPEYFRFAYMIGPVAGDYTKAGVWTRDGEWRQMAAGPSK